MADSTTCFGHTSLRKCVRVISILNMFICVLLLVTTLAKINFSFYSSCEKTQPSRNYYFGNVSMNDCHCDCRFQQMDYDMTIFCQLFILLILFYFNFNLNKATYVSNIENIKQWLTTNLIFVTIFVVYFGITLYKTSIQTTVTVWIIVIIVFVYQIYIVTDFYEDELKVLNRSAQNIITQPTSQDSTSAITVNDEHTQRSVRPETSASIDIKKPRQTSYP